MVTDNHLKSLIERGLADLLSVLDGNKKKVSELVGLFISETPSLFRQLQGYIHQRQWKEAAILIHRVKNRYGYLGLDSITTALTRWETELKAEHPDVDNNRWVMQLEKVNNSVIDELKISELYSFYLLQQVAISGTKR